MRVIGASSGLGLMMLLTAALAAWPDFDTQACSLLQDANGAAKSLAGTGTEELDGDTAHDKQSHGKIDRAAVRKQSMRVATQNCNGATNNNTTAELRTQMAQRSVAILAVQETHRTADENLTIEHGYRFIGHGNGLGDAAFYRRNGVGFLTRRARAISST